MQQAKALCQAKVVLQAKETTSVPRLNDGESEIEHVGTVLWSHGS